LEILQFRGDTGPFIYISPGAPSNNLEKVLRQELQISLRTLIQKAISSGKSLTKDGLQLKYNGISKFFRCQVLPIKIPLSDQSYYAILFTDTPKEQVGKSDAKKKKISGANNNLQDKDDEINRLTQELSEIRIHLQETIEDKEATYEELRSSNEEILSNNEELQSTNEELQTSKEEVQSSNEELSTLNEELQNRYSEIVKINDDLNNVFISSRIPLIILGSDLCIRHFTKPATKLFHLVSTDIKRPIRGIKSFLELDDLEVLIETAIDSVQSQKKEVRDKEGHWYSVQIHPYKTTDNRIDGAVISFIDIHELKIGHERDRRLATVLQDSQDAITVQDLNGKITAWNKGAEMMYGHSESEALGMNFRDIVPKNKRDEALAFIEDIINLKGVPSFETQRVTKDGRLLEVWATATALQGDNGKPELVATTERNITELHHSEKKFRSLLDSAATAMVVITNKGKIVLVNTLTENLFGYNRDELLGKSVETLIPARNQSKHAELRDAYIDAPTFRNMGDASKELFGLRKDGSEFPVNISLSPINTPEGTLISSSIMDITEQRQAEENLRYGRDCADSASRAKSDFLSSMSHEIRTPLAAIVGFSELLVSMNPSELKKKDYAKRIRNSGQRLKLLIDDILDLAKIEAGKTEIVNDQFPFIEKMKEFFANFSDMAKQNGIEFRFNFEGSLPLVLKSDENRLCQILTNIVGNAIKFTSDGSVTITVRLANTKDKSAKTMEPVIEFIVKDTGCGIPKDIQGKLFKPFVQGNTETSREYGGTGLGLIISRKLAQLMGGDVILLESSPEKGSTFLIKIQAENFSEFSSEQERLEYVKPSGEHTAEQQVEKFVGKRVLVAEDSTQLQVLIRDFLEMYGVEVVIANDGLDAIEKASEQKFDLIFMDIHMPKVDGYETTRRIREKGFKIPIIALTAGMMMEEQQKCFQAGCDECVGKPYQMKNIVKVLETYLGKS